MPVNLGVRLFAKTRYFNSLVLMMNREEFVRELKQNCSKAAVSDCITMLDKPPGRKPEQNLLNLSEWFKALSGPDRACVIEAMRMAADTTLFGVLCVLDGVRSIESTSEKTQFTLHASKAGEVTVLSPSDDFLHDILRSTS